MSDYAVHLVTFIDILGFADLVRNSDGPGDIDLVLDALHSQIGSPDEMGFKILPTLVSSFSDTVVRAVPATDPATMHDYFGNELYIIARAQRELVSRGVLLRGGITFGELQVTPTRIFGPALIAAYELESKTAIYPRILVARELLQYLNYLAPRPGFASEVEQVRTYGHGLIEQDFDSSYFVHYLDFAHLYVREAGTTQVRAHRDAIVAAWNSPAASDLRVRSKIAWQAHYHDRTVDGFPDRFFSQGNTTRDELRCDLVYGGIIPTRCK